MRSRGFTLVELLLSLALLSMLVLALVNLVDTALRILGRTEERRDLVGVSSGVLDLLAADLAALEGGPRGDLVASWWTFDLDADGAATAPFPRLTGIKRPAPGELARRFPGAAADLVEFGWALLPDAGAGAEGLGVLYRGERLPGPGERLSFFDPGFFNATGKPPAGSFEFVTGGVLWLELQWASQTSVVHDGWTVGERAEDCALAWDAWRRGRPDVEHSSLNAPAAALPAADGHALLPRRVRLILELERAEDLKRRARIAEAVEAAATVLPVDEGDLLPEPGTYLRVGEEWMELVSASGRQAAVRRGARGTRARQHAVGELVHHGWASVREVSLPAYREDWDL
jgi:prepilin-type N-terminal cleavage/methylation domain-containing protein